MNNGAPSTKKASAEFEMFVAKGVDALPDWVRNKLDNVVFVAEHSPCEEIKQHEHIEHDNELFGYYHGIPLTERGESYGVGAQLPDTIIIYEAAHLAHAQGDSKRLAKMVCETVWHEVGHYLGLNEDDVRAREHARGHISIDTEGRE